MKCEICHKAEAETAIRKEVAGEPQELFVCRACAKKEEAPAAGEALPSAEHVAPGLPPLPLMGMILDAAFEIVGKAMSLAEPACPVCGITRNEYRKRSRLGCPECYKAFSKELESAILDLHRSMEHVGKAPEQAKALWQRKQLEQALEEAVKAQRYEEAIGLRDQLKKLEPPVEPEKGAAS